MNATYRARHELLSTILARDFNDQLEVVPSAVGLHVTALARKVSVEQLSEIVQCASAAGVEVQQLSAFAFSGPAQAGLVLGYGAISTDHIEEGLRRLRSCFR
jgi:GntR family transcriptional regulator/MocR family aminotransferase